MLTEPIVDAVRVLRASPDHRVLTRLERRATYHERREGTRTRMALYVDAETTGLGPDAKLIELAAVRFSYDADGRVYEVGPHFTGFHDPGIPIPPEITDITGITDDDVRGHAVTWADVAPIFDGVSLVVAHNASFDRPVLERHFPEMGDYAWGCSYREVPWSDFGVEGGKLRHILAEACLTFYEGHRALDDCYAGVHALATANVCGDSAMSYLLDSANELSARVWAIGSPFMTKDLLKQRGYWWNDGSNGKPKSWYVDIPAVALPEELGWLAGFASVRHPKVEKLTAYTRYSERTA